MKPEHKKIIGDLIDIFDDYEKNTGEYDMNKKANVEYVYDYDSCLFCRLCNEFKSEIFLLLFDRFDLNRYKTSEKFFLDALKGNDSFLKRKTKELVSRFNIPPLTIVLLFKMEIKHYIDKKQEEETQND